MIQANSLDKVIRELDPQDKLIKELDPKGKAKANLVSTDEQYNPDLTSGSEAGSESGAPKI